MKTVEKRWEGGTTNNINATECSSLCCMLELRAACAKSVIYCGFAQAPPAS